MNKMLEMTMLKADGESGCGPASMETSSPERNTGAVSSTPLDTRVISECREILVAGGWTPGAMDALDRAFQHALSTLKPYAGSTVPQGWFLAVTGGDEVVVRAPQCDPGSMTLPVDGGVLSVRLLRNLVKALLTNEDQGAAQTITPSQEPMACDYKQLRLAELATRIGQHLRNLESDAEWNVGGRDGKVKRIWNSSASASGNRLFITYLSYQGKSSLTRAEAERYLRKLDGGFKGRHFEAFRDDGGVA